MNEKWFALSISDIEKKLKTNAASGLSRKAARSAWYNVFPRSGQLFVRKNKSVSKIFGDILADFALVLLLLLAFFAVLFDERAMGATVLAICIGNCLVSFAIHFRSQRTMEKMNLYFAPTAKVIRGGKLYRVNFDNIVPGDVIILQKGDIVPGDARLIVSDNLTVVFRANKSKAIHLSKQAHGVVAQNENNPVRMTNILHAGSVIKEGSGRAIVYATGCHTYLGAMTGGIVDVYNDNTPQELKKMKKVCSQISLISMLCILPFSIASLVISHLNGGSSTLSITFLTALALCASSMTQLSCTVCKIFFTKKIYDISSNNDPAIFRTTDAFDKFGELDYLFLMDGSALTDGILHFNTAFTAEGDIRDFENPNSTASALLKMAGLYNSAEANAITVGINLPERFKSGINEFIARGGVDTEALKIQYPLKSYLPGTPTYPVDKINYSSLSGDMTLYVATSDIIFSQCSYVLVAGKIQPISNVGIDKLKHTYNLHKSQGKTVLVFASSPFADSGKNDGKIFIGAVVLGEGIDKNAFAGIKSLQKRGIKVVSFVGGNKPQDTPEIPAEMQFGDIDTYYGLNENEIEKLIDKAHSENKSVGVVSFSEFAENVIAKADVFISCSAIVNVFSAKNEQELYTLELAGAGASASCSQAVKEASDILIQRPNGVKGGIKSLCSAVFATEVAYRNLYTLFKYVICAQFARIITVALPMIYGRPILDARHVLIYSFILDFAVIFMLAFDSKASGARNDDKNIYRIKPIKRHMTDNKHLMITTGIASLCAILLPILMDVIEIFGMYLYHVEYMFMAVLWLHVVIVYYVRYGSVKNIASVLKNKWMCGIFLGAVIFVLLINTILPIGLLINYTSNPLPFFIASFIPSIIFALIYELVPFVICRIKKK